MPASGIGVVYAAQLAERCRATPRQIEAALIELETRKPGQELGWIVRERNIVWIVNALRYEPNLYVTNEKHRTFVAKQLLPLGDRLAIVNHFRRYYADWGLAQPSEDEDNSADFGDGKGAVSDTPPDTVTDRVSKQTDTVSKHIEGEGEGSVSRNGTRNRKESSSSARATPLHERLASDHDRDALDRLLGALPNDTARVSWIADLSASLDGLTGHVIATPIQVGVALRAYAKNGKLANPNSAEFDAYLRRAKAQPTERSERAPPNGSRSKAAVATGSTGEYGKRLGGRQ
jgi:hypothetical protein